jgi:hypothetical protein
LGGSNASRLVLALPSGKTYSQTLANEAEADFPNGLKKFNLQTLIPQGDVDQIVPIDNVAIQTCIPRSTDKQ